MYTFMELSLGQEDRMRMMRMSITMVMMMMMMEIMMIADTYTALTIIRHCIIHIT